MALQWRQPPNALKAAKTLGEMLITLALNYASPFLYVPVRYKNRNVFFPLSSFYLTSSE